jgi:hypothetical protein
MIDNRYDGFKLQCKNINDYNILSFKKNNYLKGIVENVSYEYGLKYLDNITKYNMNLNWDIISKINNIGDPLNYEYIINNKKIMLSPTTLRYIQYTLDILYHIKNNTKLINIKIVEVGGGYGAQSIFLFEICHLFDIVIDSYDILDLQEVNNLQNNYIKVCQITTNNIYNINTYTLDDYKYENENYFISNYALGEFSKDWQDLYINSVVSKIEHGYICCNFSPQVPNIHDYFNTINKIIEDENPQTNCYPIKSYIIKY